MKILKKPIFVSVSPNAEPDDVFLAAKTIFDFRGWKAGETTKKFADKLKEYLGIKNVFMFESGRTSLYAILSSLGLSKGDEVLVQGFTCTAAINPILWVGVKPVYVDVLDDYNMSPPDLGKKITSKSRVVIIQHTFGYPAKVKELVEIARKNNLIIIEDAAHALGAKYDGKHIGTLGDAAILSFGRQKIISSVFGGAAATNDPKIAEGLKRFYERCDFPTNVWILRQLLHPLIFSVAKPLYDFFSVGKIIIAASRALNFFSLAVYPEEKRGERPDFSPARMPNALAVLGMNQLLKLDRFNAHRKKLAQIYTSKLSGNSKLRLIEALPGSIPVFLNFPIKLGTASAADSLILEGRKRGIYLEMWPGREVIGPPRVDFAKLCYHTGSSANGEDLASKSVVLPTNPTTSKKEAETVAEFINEFLSKNKNA
jgi:dTDP-4-amino-4,6-dideoxygalactose transaminase